MNHQALFITLEGGEGVGKSTQQVLLQAALLAKGYKVFLTHEPGATELGVSLKKLILNGESIDAKAELLLYLADRAQHLNTELNTWLKQKIVIICDRYIDSSEVYQGLARDLGKNFIRKLHEWLLQDYAWPDMTFVLDLEPTSGLQRALARQNLKNLSFDRLEQENLEFHTKVREGFLQQAYAEPKRIKIIEASHDAETVTNAILAHLQPVLDHWQSC